MSRIFQCSALLAFLLMSQSLSAQKVEISKNFWTAFKIEQNGESLKLKDLMVIAEDVPDAYSQLKKAESNLYISAIFTLAGGGFIGYSATDILINDSSNWGGLAAGTGLAIVGYLFEKSAYKKLVNGVEIYNTSQGYTVNDGMSIRLNMISNDDGIGLGINF